MTVRGFDANAAMPENLGGAFERSDHGGSCRDGRCQRNRDTPQAGFGNRPERGPTTDITALPVLRQNRRGPIDRIHRDAVGHHERRAEDVEHLDQDRIRVRFGCGQRMRGRETGAGQQPEQIRRDAITVQQLILFGELHTQNQAGVDVTADLGDILQHFLGDRQPVRDLPHGIAGLLEGERGLGFRGAFEHGRGGIGKRLFPHVIHERGRRRARGEQITNGERARRDRQDARLILRHDQTAPAGGVLGQCGRHEIGCAPVSPEEFDTRRAPE